MVRPRRVMLATSAQLRSSSTSLRLLSQLSPDRSIAITFSRPLLRLWLNILHDTYVKAQWPLNVWPDWVVEARQAPKPAVRH